MITNAQLQQFADSLAAVGVINTRQQKALAGIFPDKAKVAAFGVQLEAVFERLKTLEHNARSRGYREKEIKLIGDAVDAFTSFAKRNMERLQSRDVTAIRDQFDQFENQFTMISYEEGEGIMNIRENAQQIVSVYVDGVAGMQADTMGERTKVEMVKKAQTLISEIAASIDSVADGSSENAAKLQKQIIDGMGAWAHEFANGNFAAEALKKLEQAAAAAKSWATLKAPAVKAGGGIFGFLNKGTKEAAEGTYCTYEATMKEGSHKRILILAKYPEARSKIEAIASLIARTRAQADGSGLEAMKQSRDMYKQQAEQLEAELDAVALQYDLSGNTDSTLANRIVALNDQIDELYDYVEEQTIQIDAQQSSIQANEMILGSLEFTYNILTSQINNKSNLVSLAGLIDFAILSKILENTADQQEMMAFVNTDAMVKMANSMGIETNASLREMRREVRGITHEGERTRTATQETAREQRQQQANSQAQEILNRRRRTQRPAEQTAQPTEQQTTGGISLDGLAIGNDT